MTLPLCRLTAVAVGVILVCNLAPARAESLSEVVNEVLLQHPSVRSSQALLNATDERVRQARSNFYPNLELQALAADAQDQDRLLGEVDRSTRRADAFLRWNLFRGLADRNAVRMAEKDSQAASEDLADAHENVTLQITAAYLEVLRLRQRLALARTYSQESYRLEGEVRRYVEVGKVAQAETDLARMSLVDAEWQLAQLQGQLEGAEQRYKLLAGRQPGQLSDPALDQAAPDIQQDEMMEQVLAGNRRVRAAMARAAARAEEVGVAGGALYPTLALELRKNLESSIDPQPVTDTRHTTQVQLNYEVPLGGANYSRKREAVARKQAAMAAADAALLEARASIARVWSAWVEARRIAPRLSQRAAASSKVVAAYDLQYSAGRRSLQDLIGVRGAHFRALSDAIDNRSEQLLGAAQVLSLLGRLRSALSQPLTLQTAGDEPQENAGYAEAASLRTSTEFGQAAVSRATPGKAVKLTEWPEPLSLKYSPWTCHQNCPK